MQTQQKEIRYSILEDFCDDRSIVVKRITQESGGKSYFVVSDTIAQALGFTSDKEKRNFSDWCREVKGGGKNEKVGGRVAYNWVTILRALDVKAENISRRYSDEVKKACSSFVSSNGLIFDSVVKANYTDIEPKPAQILKIIQSASKDTEQGEKSADALDFDTAAENLKAPHLRELLKEAKSELDNLRKENENLSVENRSLSDQKADLERWRKDDQKQSLNDIVDLKKEIALRDEKLKEVDGALEYELNRADDGAKKVKQLESDLALSKGEVEAAKKRLEKVKEHAVETNKKALEKYNAKKAELEKERARLVELEKAQKKLNEALEAKTLEIEEINKRYQQPKERFKRFFESPVFLIVPLALVIFASFIDMGIVFSSTFKNPLASWLLAFVFSLVVLVFTFNSRGVAGKAFAILFALVEALVNSVYFEVWIFEGRIELITKVCATIGLPLAIVAYTYLFERYTR